MTRRRKDDLERAIETALAPGAFIGYRHMSDLIDDVEAVRAGMVALIQDGEAARAVALLQTFIAACYEKSEEIDDSLGSFGQFVGELFCDWIRARQAAGAEADETAATLLAWMDDDDQGYFLHLETDVVKVLDRPGSRALERAVQGRVEQSEKGSFPRREGIGILKAIYRQRRDVGAYAGLCEAEGGLTPADCESLAEMSLKRRRPEEALAWVERGLAAETAGHRSGSAAGLRARRREILEKLGRRGEALASAWEDYQRAPSVYSYEDLLEFVPRRERARWHDKALAVLDKADLGSRIDLLVQTKERERLAVEIEKASRKEIVGLSHFTTQPAADYLEKTHPLLAAKAHVAMALRILEAKKSTYYHAALQNLEKARKLMLAKGQQTEWQALAIEIREAHRRKSGFMPGFEAVVAGSWAKAPTFLDRARRRWDRRARKRRGG